MSSFSVILFPGAPITLPRWEGLCTGTPAWTLPFGWGFPFDTGFDCQGRAMGRIKAVATQEAREAACRASAARADARAAAFAPVIAEIRASGITQPYVIAAALTARGVPTARGHHFWGDASIKSLLRRLDRLLPAGTLGSQIEKVGTAHCQKSPLPGSASAASQ
jgi:hypothetical protein